MSPTITLIDYGSGNLLSVARAFEHCGAQVAFAHTAEDVERAERLVLPGVGAFADGMQGLRERGLVEPIKHYAASGRPLLGICLGMQMLAGASEEFGLHEGLGLVPGRVVPLPAVGANGRSYKVPHVGWSELRRPDGVSWERTLLENTPESSAVYLVHSYHVQPEAAADRLAECDYGGNRVCAAVRRGNVFGCQFHPEKSGPAGLRMLAAFIATPAR